MNPLDPDPRDPNRPQTHYRDADRGEGMGAIIAVVAIAALIIVGMLYIMQPPAEGPAKVTTEAPTATSPAPKPTTPAPGK